MGFFGKNSSLLYQEVEEGAQGGGGADLQQEQEAVDNLATEGVPAPEAPEVEPAASVPEETSAFQQSLRRVDRRQQPLTFEKKDTKGDIRVTGELGDRFTIGETLALEEIQQRENAFKYAVGAQTLQEGLASEAAQLQWAEINQKQYEGRQRLIEDAFPRFQERQRQLEADIQAARQMRVNPYNFMQSVGRTGRVASVLAVGLGQLAAGAGEPNSVWQRLESAINQDILAQKANINQVWRGIEAQRQLTQDDLNLIESQFNFEDRARAVGYAALAARLGAAKQHAVNEITYLNMQMIEERALAKSIHAAAQARAKESTFMLDARVHSVHAAMRKAEKMRALKVAEAARMEQSGSTATTLQAAQELGGPLQTLDGSPAAPGAPVDATSPPTAQPGAAPPSAAVARRRTPQGVEAQEGPSAARRGAPAPQTPEAPSVELPAGPVGASPEQTGSEPEVVEEPGQQGYTGTSRDLLETPTFNTLREAQHYTREVLRPPDPRDPVFVDSSTGDFDENRYQAMVRHHRQLQRYPEALMNEFNNVNFQGEKSLGFSNVIHVPGGNVLHIRPDLHHILSDSEARNELEVEIANRYAGVTTLAEMAENFARTGGTGVAGFVLDGEEGFVWKPTDATAQLAVTRLRAGLERMGGLAAKSIDTGGRMSNEDLIWGKNMVGLILDKGTIEMGVEQLVQRYQELTGKPGATFNDVKLSTIRALGLAAKDQLQNLDGTIGTKIIQSGDAIRDAQLRAERVYSFVPETRHTWERQTQQQDAEEKLEKELQQNLEEPKPEGRADRLRELIGLGGTVLGLDHAKDALGDLGIIDREDADPGSRVANEDLNEGENE